MSTHRAAPPAGAAATPDPVPAIPDPAADQAPDPAPEAPARRPGRGPSRETFSATATVGAFAVVFVVYALWLGTDFYDVARLAFDTSRSTPQLILAVAVAVCLAGHQFDLSVAAVATGGCFMTVGLFISGGMPMGWAIVCTILVGAIAGLFNGFLVTVLHVNAFIATLGTGGLFAGFTVVYSAGTVVGPTPDSGPLPSWFSGVGSMGDFQNKVPPAVALATVAAVVLIAIVSLDQRYPGPERLRRVRVAGSLVVAALLVLGAWALGITAEMDWMIAILVLLGLVVWVFMKYTAAGQAIYAVGGSPGAASFAGIRPQRVSLGLFVFSGTIAAIAGVLLASQQGSAAPGVADPLLLPAFSGAFLSTVIISRGRFHIWGAVAGSLALVYVTDGLVVGGVPYTWTQVINGAVLIATVALSMFLQRRPGRH